MFADLPQTKQDLKREAIIRHKQQIENERKERIFNPRTRVIGVDCAGLAKQLAEKREQKKHEHELDLGYATHENTFYHMVDQRANETLRNRRQRERELNDYRKFEQSQDARTRYKSSDSMSIDNSISVESWKYNSLQFDGEDPAYAERMRAQRNQQKDWLLQQICENDHRRNREHDMEKTVQKATDSINYHVGQKNEMAQNARRRAYVLTSEYNRSLAAEQHARNINERQQEELSNHAEIYNNITSPMLNECKDYAGSNFGGRRKNVTMYKGLSEDDLAVFWKEKYAQLQQQKQSRDDEKNWEKQYEQTVEGFNRMGLAKEYEVKQQQYRQAVSDSKSNLNLAKEQTARKHYLDNVEYTNQPTEQYFNQFNTTTR